MRSAGLSVNDIKQQIKDLVGKTISMEVNRGRRKIENFQGIISKVYPSVFTIKIHDNANIDSLTYSYSDVLCGDVKILLVN